MKNELSATSKANMLLDPTVWGLLREQANVIVKSGFLPSAINTPEKAIAVLMKGIELNMPPMQAVSHLFVVNGKVSQSAESMLAKIFEAFPNLEFSYKKRDNQACVISVRRPGGKLEDFSFTIEDAKAAGLGGQVWNKYPRSMLRSRCISEMARSIFPDILMGASYTPEELGANVSESGEVIEVKVEAKQEPKKIEEKKPEEEKITKDELHHMMTMMSEKKNVGDVTQIFRKGMKEKYGIEAASDLNKKQYQDVLLWLSGVPNADEENEGAVSSQPD